LPISFIRKRDIFSVDIFPHAEKPAVGLKEVCANKSPYWSAGCAINVRQTSVCRGLIGKPLERDWRAFLPGHDKLEVCRTFGVALFTRRPHLKHLNPLHISECIDVKQQNLSASPTLAVIFPR
jgi:hypothetical protein